MLSTVFHIAPQICHHSSSSQNTSSKLLHTPAFFSSLLYEVPPQESTHLFAGKRGNLAIIAKEQIGDVMPDGLDVWWFVSSETGGAFGRPTNINTALISTANSVHAYHSDKLGKLYHGLWRCTLSNGQTVFASACHFDEQLHFVGTKEQAAAFFGYGPNKVYTQRGVSAVPEFYGI